MLNIGSTSFDTDGLLTKTAPPLNFALLLRKIISVPEAMLSWEEGRKEGRREGGGEEERKEEGREGGNREGWREGGREGGRREGKRQGGRGKGGRRVRRGKM